MDSQEPATLNPPDLDAQFQPTLELMPDPALIVDASSRIVALNDEALRMFGYERAELLGQSVDVLIPPHRTRGHAEHVRRYLEAPVQRPMGASLELTACGRDGLEIPVDIALKPIRHKSGLFALAAVRDISVRAKAEQQLRFVIQHDDLTGLCNRSILIDRVEQVIGDPDGCKYALLFMDLNRFKLVNDTLGHDVGDHLLKSVARRLGEFFDCFCVPPRRDQRTTLARLGGDEFVVLFERQGDSHDVQILAEKLRAHLATPYELGPATIERGMSIGIVPDVGAYASPADVIRDADIAMFRAKTSDDGRPVIFDKDMRCELVERMRLEVDLARALEEGQLSLMYQPIVCLESGQLTGFEALLRWRHPELGLVSPDRFIPIAEESGLIVPFGEWTLQTAARQLVKWQERFVEQRALFITVNVSKRQLLDPGFAAFTKRVVRQAGLRPEQIKLEVTESVIMKAVVSFAPVLRSLRAAGFHICMDDFGTGESSLIHLHQFPIDVLKIDRAFIANLNSSRQYSAIVHAVVTLAHNLGMTVVAEGVETCDQVCQLQALECDCGQGYHFARPLSEYDADALLGSQAGASA